MTSLTRALEPNSDSMNPYKGRQTPTQPLYYPPMRVISGRYRGRRLKTPKGLHTRPILDRVKASLFDWLGSRLARPGHLPPVNVCDLFCGCGSQGIEALSRGAAFCTFVETDGSALADLRENLTHLGVGPEASIIARSAEKAILATPDGRGFRMIFVDPPYRLSEDVSPDSLMGRVAARFGNEIPTVADAVVIWRHDNRCILPSKLPGGWTMTERRSFGSMAITLFEEPLDMGE